jgi:methylated-DNA-[protein]-cysteine S-methyltransferase
MSIYYTQTPSPVGSLLLMANAQGLCGLHMEHSARGPGPIQPDWAHDHKRFEPVIRQLDEYFSGRRKSFDVSTLALRGTPFQQSVWHALMTIPYGQTISYGELARRIDNPKAVRAVGLANGRNPVSIIVPCHRVIGADGSLTGYGGGLPRKQFLLALERDC